MTGKITVGTIQDTDGNTVASTYVTNGSAKAWAEVGYSDGTPITEGTASLNISTYTDIGTGDYQANFTNNMNSDDFSKAGMGIYNIRVLTFSGLTAGSSFFRGNNYNVVPNAYADNGNTFVIHGDLA